MAYRGAEAEEEHIMLRLPLHLAEAVRTSLRMGKKPKIKLHIYAKERDLRSAEDQIERQCLDSLAADEAEQDAKTAQTVSSAQGGHESVDMCNTWKCQCGYTRNRHGLITPGTKELSGVRRSLCSMCQNSRYSSHQEDIRRIEFEDCYRSKDGKRYPAALLDLPCVVEVQKTHDRSLYMKAGDISQMIVVGESKKSEFGDSVFSTAHGLTPPAHNIVKLRGDRCFTKLDRENLSNKAGELLVKLSERASYDEEEEEYQMLHLTEQEVFDMRCQIAVERGEPPPVLAVAPTPGKKKDKKRKKKKRRKKHKHDSTGKRIRGSAASGTPAASADSAGMSPAYSDGAMSPGYSDREGEYSDASARSPAYSPTYAATPAGAQSPATSDGGGGRSPEYNPGNYSPEYSPDASHSAALSPAYSERSGNSPAYSADGGHGAQSPARSDGGGSNISGRSEEYTGFDETSAPAAEAAPVEEEPVIGGGDTSFGWLD